MVSVPILNLSPFFRMKARNILLNHFSQRYPKIPKLPAPSPDEEGTVRPVISISFDLMSVKLGEMWKMAHYMPAISELFAESEAEEGDNSAEAVEHDINASVEDEEGLANDGKTSTSSSSASTSAMTATKQGYTKGHGRQAAAARPAIKAKGPTPVKLYANKAEKLAARNLRREAKKRAESEASGASPDGSLEKREGSPLSSGPVAKRPKSDEGLDESQSPKAEPPTLRKDDEKDTGPVKSNEGFEGSQLLKAEPPSSPKVEKKRAQPVKIPFMTQISL
jgi:ribonuclease Z